MSRHKTITEKIHRQKTGLNGSLFVHVDHADGEVLAIRFSEKGKDQSVMDGVLTILGDTATDIVRAIQGLETIREAEPK